MTIDDIKKLAEVLQHKENAKDTKRKINRVFTNKSCATIIKELNVLMQQLEKKRRPKALLLVVLSLLHKNPELRTDIQKALASENLIPVLYGALCILLGGKSSTMVLKIEIEDSQFPNKYEYLTRFCSQFYDPKFREVLYVSEILAKSDFTKFEELAFKDTTRIILLNMISCQIDVTPSKRLITRLLKEGDELQANIGFYFAVFGITREIYDCVQFRKGSDSLDTKAEEQRNKDIVAYLEAFHIFYRCCSIERRASLLINYILTENQYPSQFGYWLMEAELQESLIEEITSSEKIRNLDKLYKVVYLIHNFPIKDVSGSVRRKDKLYAATVRVLKKFVLAKKGIYSWDEKQKTQFYEICKVLPKKYLGQLQTFLKKVASSLMISRLDQMVRFSIYLEDKSKWEICQGMMDTIESVGARTISGT